MRVAGDEQERLLSAHRAAERVDPVLVDVHAPRARDRRHARKIRDLSRRAPRVPVQLPPLAGGVDQCEAALAGEVAPEERVVALVYPAPVRRDDEWDALAVVVGRQKQPRGPDLPVVRPVVDEADLGVRRGRDRLFRGARRADKKQGSRDGEQEPHRPNGRSATAKMGL